MTTLRKTKYFFLGIRARMGSAEDLGHWTAQIDKVIDGTILEMQKQERSWKRVWWTPLTYAPT
jgi:hypothetical protein